MADDRRPIRVLHVLVSSDVGGGPAHVRDVVARLPRDEFSVTVAAPARGASVDDFVAAGAAFVPVAADRLGWRPLAALVRLVRERGIDLVHSHGKGAGLYGRLAARITGIPAVHTFHGIHDRAHAAPARALYLALERALARMTAVVIHVSESQARIAERLGLAPPGRTRVIVNGIDGARVAARLEDRAHARAALGVPPDLAAVGTVARFDPVKDLGTLVEAAAVALRDRIAFALVLVGDGPERPRVERLAHRLGIAGAVIFPGAMPEASRRFSALDLYVSASRREGLPLAIVEAMASGLPVVASRVVGHVDVVADGDTGVLVAPGDVTAFAAAISQLLGEPDRRRRLGEAARRRALGEFSADAMAERIAAVYKAIRRAAEPARSV